MTDKITTSHADTYTPPPEEPDTALHLNADGTPRKLTEANNSAEAAAIIRYTSYRVFVSAIGQRATETLTTELL